MSELTVTIKTDENNTDLVYIRICDNISREIKPETSATYNPGTNWINAGGLVPLSWWDRIKAWWRGQEIVDDLEFFF